MSQPKPVSARQGRRALRGRESATTAEGIAGERALLATRFGTQKASRVTQAARRLERAARADARSV